MHCEIKELLDASVDDEQSSGRYELLVVILAVMVVPLVAIFSQFFAPIKSSSSLLLSSLSLTLSAVEDENVVRIRLYTFFRIDDDGILQETFLYKSKISVMMKRYEKQFNAVKQ